MSDAGVAVDDATAARAKQLAEDIQKAKDAGWTNPIPFNYETVAGGQPDVRDEGRDSANWLSDAVVYEWDDDFGEVGPPNPELEKVLYENPDMMRAGGAIQALSFQVIVNAKEEVHPVREVNLATAFLMSPTKWLNSSTRPAFTQLCSRMWRSAGTTSRLLSRLTASHLS